MTRLSNNQLDVSLIGSTSSSHWVHEHKRKREDIIELGITILLQLCYYSSVLSLYQFTTLPLYRSTNLLCCISQTLQLYRSTNLLCWISQTLQLYCSTALPIYFAVFLKFYNSTASIIPRNQSAARRLGPHNNKLSARATLTIQQSACIAL